MKAVWLVSYCQSSGDMKVMWSVSYCQVQVTWRWCGLWPIARVLVTWRWCGLCPTVRVLVTWRWCGLCPTARFWWHEGDVVCVLMPEFWWHEGDVVCVLLPGSGDIKVTRSVFYCQVLVIWRRCGLCPTARVLVTWSDVACVLLPGSGDMKVMWSVSYCQSSGDMKVMWSVSYCQVLVTWRWCSLACRRARRSTTSRWASASSYHYTYSTYRGTTLDSDPKVFVPFKSKSKFQSMLLSRKGPRWRII